MATNHSIEQIQWNVANGFSSHDDVKTLLSRYQELLEDVKYIHPEMYKMYKRREKKA